RNRDTHPFPTRRSPDLTAKADRSDIRYGMELGADDYILKPFRFAQLRQAIRTRLEKRAVIDQIYQTTIDQLRRNLINEHAQFLRSEEHTSELQSRENLV